MPRVSQQKAGIPPPIIASLSRRLQKHAKAKWPACKGIAVRSRGLYAYVDVESPESSELEPFCRLRYLGNVESWEFAYFTWSRQGYELSVLDNGLPFGSPEDCFDAAALPAFGFH